MVPPFEAAAFGLKPGETSGIVESDFGYHIIRLTEARGGEKKPFEAVRAELEGEVRNQLAQKRYNDAAVEFGDTVFEQSESLKPVADKYKLAVQRADRVLRAPAPGASGPDGQPALPRGLVRRRDDSRQAQHEGDRHRQEPARLRPCRRAPAGPAASARRGEGADPRPARGAEGGRAVVQEGGRAARRGQGCAGNAFPGETVTVSRAQTRDLPRSLLDAVMRAPQASLPTVVGIPLGTDGYAIARIVKVVGRDPAVADPQRGRAQYAQAWAAAESDAAYTAWKTRLEARITENAKLDRDAAASEPR
jgi:peptidyl-prolyl cis-trans isomerase D